LISFGLHLIDVVRDVGSASCRRVLSADHPSLLVLIEHETEPRLGQHLSLARVDWSPSICRDSDTRIGTSKILC
jgi:hypothetical protein